MSLGPLKTKCNNKDLCSLCQLNEAIHAKEGKKEKSSKLMDVLMVQRVFMC